VVASRVLKRSVIARVFLVDALLAHVPILLFRIGVIVLVSILAHLTVMLRH